MIRDPQIAAFRDELERLGIVVAPHRDHLCVRLPLFASVRVRVDAQGRLDCEPMFGPLNRTHALLASATLLTAATGASLFVTGVSALTFGVAFVTIMSGFGSVWRFILTESCITRIQLLWAGHGPTQRRAAVDYPSIAALRAVDAPAPDSSPPQRIKAETQR